MSLDAIKAARAYVETVWDGSAAEKGLKSLERQLDRLGTSAQALGMNLMKWSAPLLGLGALAVNSFTAAGSALDDMSQRTGIGVSTLSELSHAAQMSGTSIEALESALVKQTKFLGDLQTGSKTAAATLSQLGLSAEDLAGQSGDEAFLSLAEAVSQVPDEVTRANLAMDVFGKGATELLPLLNQGAAGIAHLRQQARDLGIVMSDEDAAAAAEFGDLLDQLWSQLSAATNQVGAALVPALTEMLVTLQPLLTAGIEWLRQNDGIILTIAGVAAGVFAGGAAIAGMGIVISALATGIGAVVTVGSGLVAVLGFLMSPIGIITAGIGGLIAMTWDWSAGWGTLVDSLGESLGTAVSLIQNGEISLAMELLWAQVELLWTQGVRAVVSQIGEFVTTTINVLAAGIDKLGTMLDKTRNALARQIAAAGEYVGLLPEGTSETLNEMQQAGQVGQSSLHGLAESLKQSGDEFLTMGNNVGELEKKLAAIKGTAVEANVKAEIAKADKAAQVQARKGGGPVQPLLDYSGSPLGGTFSANAGRQLYSMGGGESKVVGAVDRVTAAVEKTDSTIRDLWGKVGA